MKAIHDITWQREYAVQHNSTLSAQTTGLNTAKCQCKHTIVPFKLSGNTYCTLHYQVDHTITCNATNKTCVFQNIQPLINTTTSVPLDTTHYFLFGLGANLEFITQIIFVVRASR